MPHSLPPPDDSRSISTELAAYVDHFRARVVQDALAQATVAHWLRRAEAFESAAPRPDDYPGQATADDLAQAVARCAEIARACRNRAVLAEIDQIPPQTILAAIREVA